MEARLLHVKQSHIHIVFTAPHIGYMGMFDKSEEEFVNGYLAGGLLLVICCPIPSTYICQYNHFYKKTL